MLDMFMFKFDGDPCSYINMDKKDVMKQFQKALNAGENARVNDSKMTFLTYWSGANQICRWLIENSGVVHNFHGPYHLMEEEVRMLAMTCKTVLEKGVDKNGQPVEAVCQWFLPTLNGPDFGDVDYDENYLQEVKLTYNFLNELLQTTNWNNETILLYVEWE